MCTAMAALHMTSIVIEASLCKLALIHFKKNGGRFFPPPLPPMRRGLETLMREGERETGAHVVIEKYIGHHHCCIAATTVWRKNAISLSLCFAFLCNGAVVRV